MTNAAALEPPRASTRLFDAYRATHEQGFVPIFAADDFDSKTLVEACVEAGCRAIEYTQRRWDADWMIPWIRKHFPGLYVLVGSTLDDDDFVRQARRRHPQLRTLAELAEMGADGFVSLAGWNAESIRRWAPTRLVVPCAMTLREAFVQVSAGAHFVKVIGPDPQRLDLDFVRICRFPAAFECVPILYSSWVTPPKVAEVVSAGALLFGAGLEFVLRDEPRSVSMRTAARKIRRYLEAARKARERFWPRTLGGSREEWLEGLPHVHPFAE